MRIHTRLLSVVLVAALVLTGAATGVQASPGADKRPTAAAADHRAEQAEAALAGVQGIFAGHPGPARTVRPHGREATLALRDLYFARHALRGADRAAAEAFLARPTDHTPDVPDDIEYEGETEATPECGTHVCIHYIAPGVSADGVPATDEAPADGTPDYVKFALDTMEQVHTAYFDAGYKAPKSDVNSTNNGGNGLTDIYLAHVGDDQLYGFCTSDDPTPDTWDISAYCVLDNDYAEFPAHTPEDNFRVTAAHEYFHAVQFAYDAAEDRWFMEASATWAEDELFDDVDDNLFYLPYGQLARPGIPLDKFTDLFHYGNWIYLRYLTERYPTEAGGMPVLMRNLWDKVDAAETTDPDMYAVQALKSALAARDTTFTASYARFAEAGRRRTSFSEGVANSYPVKPLTSSKTLTPAARSTGPISKVLHHLSSATYRITPGTRLTATDWRLRLVLDLPSTSRGSTAVVTVYKKSGAVSVVTVPLTSAGDASRSYMFSRATVKYVEVTLVNASTRFQCWQDIDSPYSCQGFSRDDGLSFKLRGTAYRS